MTKTSTLLLLALAGPAALAAPDAPVPAAAPETTLYDGKAAGPATVSIADWGGGDGQDSTETYLFGGHSLKITTLDLYQGARLTFPTPVSLAGDSRVFQMTIRRGGATLHYDPRTTSPFPPGDTQNGAIPGFSQGQFQGGQGQFQGGRNGRRRGNRGGNRGGGGNTALIPPVDNLRLHFTFADGRQADILRPVPDASDSLAGEGWYSINVPVSALKLGGGAAPLLKSVTVGGDHYGVFFVGRIKLGTDKPTLGITIDAPDTVLPGQPVTLIAKGGSGFSALKYSWDVDSGDDSQDQMTGEQVTTRYFEGGQDHTVTLSVTDLDGLKSPVTLTKVIHVKEQGNGPGFPPAGSPGYQPAYPSGGQGFPGGGQGFPGGAPPDGKPD